ncbi:Nudix hydrolase 4 [Platanthera zijinensis]|uniref:Nudix hydrolase 4 n=1 Tax=Platanthera zijinensis TaxID=2320716 RepID=A0AAP0GAT5_9ASPA
MMFPKGGWDLDETMKQAASREASEEAGVHGHVESNLGKWMYKSNKYNIFYEGIMFPLNVIEELSCWPEMEVWKRRWVSLSRPESRSIAMTTFFTEFNNVFGVLNSR